MELEFLIEQIIDGPIITIKRVEIFVGSSIVGKKNSQLTILAFILSYRNRK